MKIQILLPVLLASCALAAYFTEVNPSARSSTPGNIQVSTLSARSIQPAPRAEEFQRTPASSPETEELRALLKHSLVTGGHARAFMELLTRDDSQFQEYIELVLAKADQGCVSSAQFSKMTGPAQSPKPDAALEP